MNEAAYRLDQVETALLDTISELPAACMVAATLLCGVRQRLMGMAPAGCVGCDRLDLLEAQGRDLQGQLDRARRGGN